MDFHYHTSAICKKAGAQLRVLQRLSHYVDLSSRLSIFRCFILAHFNYCSLVWNFCGETCSRKIEQIQYRALKFVYNFISDYNSLLKKANLPTLALARKRAILIEVFKSIHHISSPFMWDLFKTKEESTYNLRRKNRLSIIQSKLHISLCLSNFRRPFW